MTRTSRVRTRTLGVPTGSASDYNNGVLQASDSNYGTWYNAVCQDSHGRPLDDSALNIQTEDFSEVFPISGNGDYTWFGQHRTDVVENYVVPYTSQTISPVSVSMMSDGEAATAVLARTNPSRSVVNPPTLIQDIVEFPRYIKDLTRLARKPVGKWSVSDFAGHYLGTAFGWLPVVQDVHDILDFQLHVDRRHNELNRLYSGKGLRRSLQLDSATANRDNNTGFYYLGSSTLKLRSSDFTQAKKWATVHWKPTTVPKWDPTDANRIRDAKRLVLGLSYEGISKGAWDILPWSWMLGWFTNLGTFLQTNSNSIPALPTSVCVMTQTKTVRTFSQVGVIATQGSTNQEDRYSRAGGQARSTTKHRSVNVAPTIVAHLPHFEAGRLGTLGALIGQRFRY